MYIAPKALAEILVRPVLGPRICQSLIQRFEVRGRCWQVFAKVEVPEHLPESRDPLQLALRRLARRNVEGLRIMHRVAVQHAAQRPLGLLFLALEEAMELEDPNGQPALESDRDLQTFRKLMDGLWFGGRREPWNDLQARFFAESARRQITAGGSDYRDFLLDAHRYALFGTRELELDVFLLETMAMGFEARGQIEDALHRQREAANKIHHYSVPERINETLLIFLEMAIRGHGAEALRLPQYHQVRNRLDETAETLSPPQRQRVASLPVPGRRRNVPDRIRV